MKILKSFSETSQYVEQIQRSADQERSALGFLPQRAYHDAASLEKLYVAVGDEGSFQGHLIFGGVFPLGKVIQVYCVPEFRRSGVTDRLMTELVEHYTDRNFLSISARVAADLPRANRFYERNGFQTKSIVPGGKTKNRMINIKVLELETPSLFEFFGAHTEEAYPTIRFANRAGNEPPIYAVDLNVLFDVGKQRIRKEEAGLVFSAAFNKDIRMVIADEFIRELQRTAIQAGDDPYLQIALNIPRLPSPTIKEYKALHDLLAENIFPDRYRSQSLSIQDKSDLKHLAGAITGKANGFITSENAILRANDFLMNEFGLDVLGVSDFSGAMLTGSGLTDPVLNASVGVAALSVQPAQSIERHKIDAFLLNKVLPVGVSIGDDVTSDGKLSESQIAILDGEEIVCFASWYLSTRPRKQAECYVCANEDHPSARTAIDYAFGQLCRTTSDRAATELNLTIPEGHSVTRSVAVSYGFRSNVQLSAAGSRLYKVCYGKVVFDNQWNEIRQWIRATNGASLQEAPPVYDGINTKLSVNVSDAEVDVIALHDFETLLSPMIFLARGRTATIVPIWREHADDLLGTTDQFSMLGIKEASLLKERVYFGTPRAAPKLRPGKIILFYESSRKRGRKCIVAMARVTESRVLALDEIKTSITKHGVLESGELNKIGKSKTKLVTHFDNIFKFSKPVGLEKMRELGCDDGTNFISATEITQSQLIQIVSEGGANV